MSEKIDEDAIAQKAQEAASSADGELSEFLAKLNVGLDHIGQIVSQHGDDAATLVLEAARISGLWGLVLGTFFLIVGGIILFLYYKFFYQEAVNMAEKDRDIFPLGLFWFGFAVISVITAGLSLSKLLFLEYWLLVYDPKLGLAYKALSSAGIL